MPIIQVNTVKSCVDEQKETLIAAIAAAVMDSIGAPKEKIGP